MATTQFKLEVLSKGRAQLQTLLDSHSDNDLLKIPEGFNNNLLWNIGHLIVTQHLLVYKLQGLPVKLDEAFVESFRKGSTPDAKTEIKWKKLIERELNNGIENLKIFLEQHSASSIDYPTSFGVNLTSIEQVVDFLLMHEGLHIGFCNALRKQL